MVAFLMQEERFFSTKGLSSTLNYTTEGLLSSRWQSRSFSYIISIQAPFSSYLPGKYTDSFADALEKDLQILFCKEKSVQ